MGWLPERWRFVSAAEREGLTWFVEVWKFMAPVVAVAGLLQVGAWLLGFFSLWLAVGSAVALLLLLFAEGAFRLWRKAAAVAYPVFPRHGLDLGNPMYMSLKDPLDDFILFDLTFVNRTDTPVALVVGVFWEWERTEGEVLGPYSLAPVTTNLGDLKVLDWPASVGPHLPFSGQAAFSVGHAIGITEGNYGDVILRPGLRLFVRLTDLNTDAQTDAPLPVRVFATPTERTE